MRFVYGAIPPSRVFNPQDNGWTPLCELKPTRFAAVGVVLTLPFIVAFVFLLTDRPGGLRQMLRDDPLPTTILLLATILMVPVHELIHALAYGRGLRSPHMIIGFWPKLGSAYAIFDSPMPRERVLLMLIAPLFTLSVLPLLCLPLLEGVAADLAMAFCLLHAALCGGDAIVFWHLFSQVPRKALVHNNGWQTYWHIPAGSGWTEP